MLTVRHRARPQVREGVLHIVGFSQWYSRVTQHCVSCDQMKVELRQGPVPDILTACHIEDHPIREFDGNLAVCLRIEGLRFKIGEEEQSVSDVGSGLVHGTRALARILSFFGKSLPDFGQGIAAQSGDSFVSLQTTEPHLRRERKHVWSKTVSEEFARL